MPIMDICFTFSYRVSILEHGEEFVRHGYMHGEESDRHGARVYARRTDRHGPRVLQYLNLNPRMTRILNPRPLKI